MEEQISRIAAQVADRLFVEVEASGRHVHLTKDQAMTLFGHGLTPKRPLSQPGQFVCQERVEVLGPKGSFPKVAVLGPERKEGQVEISLTDGVTLGLTDGQVVRLKMFTARPLVFDDVVVRVDPSFTPRVHIDFDEANACAYQSGDFGMIIRG